MLVLYARSKPILYELILHYNCLYYAIITNKKILKLIETIFNTSINNQKYLLEK